MVIYKTTNLINGKIYIGKDSKNNIKYLGGGKLLKLAFKKYGKANFNKEIIEQCDNSDELNEREKYWINHFNSRTKGIGYNILIGGDISPMENNTHSIEAKQKMSLNHIDVSGQNNPMFGKTFKDCWIESGLTENEVKIKMDKWLKKRSELSTGENNAMYGMLRYGIDNPFFNKKHSIETRIHLSNKAKKKIVEQYSLDGTLIKEWPSTMEVYRELNINCRGCCRGVSKTAHGYIWKYKN